MVVDIRVDGVPRWTGSEITVTEDATPLDASSSFGGVPQVSFTVAEGGDAKSLLNTTVVITDTVRGTVEALVRALSGDRVNTKVDAHSTMVALVADRTALPHVGTLESAVLYYFGLCGIDSGVTVDASVASTAVVFPGWYGNVWTQLKNLCAAFQVEIAPVDGGIVVRPPRSNSVGVRHRESAFAWGLDESQLAQTVEAWYYECAEITDGLVVGNELSPLTNIAAGEVYEFDVSLSASLSSVSQPVAVAAVGWGDSDASEYSVLDQFDEPVSAAEWAGSGGRVTVTIDEDTRGLHVTVVGSQDRSRAPFKIAAVGAAGDLFSTLRIVGTGVTFNRKLYTLPACVDSRASDVVGAEVDSDFLGSWAHAHSVLLRTAMSYGGASKRITGSERMRDLAFGNVAGARVLEDSTYYRVRSASITPNGVGYSAEADTTIDDVNTVWAGLTIGDWNTTWAGLTLGDVELRPLSVPTSGAPVVPSGYGSGVYGGPPVYGG